MDTTLLAKALLATLSPADRAWLEGEIRRGFGPSAVRRLLREIGA